MSAEPPPIVVALIGSGAVSGLVTWLARRRTDTAMATDVITTAAGRQVQLISEDNERLRRVVAELEARVAQMEAKALATTAQLAAVRTENSRLHTQVEHLTGKVEIVTRRLDAALKHLDRWDPMTADRLRQE